MDTPLRARLTNMVAQLANIADKPSGWEWGKPMTKEQRIKLEFEPLFPVYCVNEAQAAEVFGKYYEYDFPKWCKENNIKCFYKKETRVYVIFPASMEEK